MNKSCQTHDECVYTEDMTTTTFSTNKDTFEIVELKTHNDNFRTQLGWTHFAAVKRINGKKVYYCNLFISNGEVLKSNVVL